MMYLFISENEVKPYNGEVLKQFVGNRLVKTISNPTDTQLREFGYKSLLEEAPEEREGYIAVPKYTDGLDIVQSYEYVEEAEEAEEENLSDI